MCDGRVEGELAVGHGLRPVLRIHGGETNNWYPDLAEDNHYIDQPYLPEDGYHLSKDLADKALSFIQDAQQSEPAKPWYLWFCHSTANAHGWTVVSVKRDWAKVFADR